MSSKRKKRKAGTVDSNEEVEFLKFYEVLVVALPVFEPCSLKSK